MKAQRGGAWRWDVGMWGCGQKFRLDCFCVLGLDDLEGPTSSLHLNKDALSMAPKCTQGDQQSLDYQRRSRNQASLYIGNPSVQHPSWAGRKLVSPGLAFHLSQRLMDKGRIAAVRRFLPPSPRTLLCVVLPEASGGRPWKKGKTHTP